MTLLTRLSDEVASSVLPIITRNNLERRDSLVRDFLAGDVPAGDVLARDFLAGFGVFARARRHMPASRTHEYPRSFPSMQSILENGAQSSEAKCSNPCSLCNFDEPFSYFMIEPG